MSLSGSCHWICMLSEPAFVLKFWIRELEFPVMRSRGCSSPFIKCSGMTSAVVAPA